MSDKEGFSNEMDIAVKGAILEAIKTDPQFKEQFLEELNKKDDSDKDIVIDIGLPVMEVDDNKMRYIIATGKRVNEYSQTSIQSMTVSKRLLKDLYLQLKEIFKE